MKRLCKDVDITDRGLISRAVYACLRKKYKRNDTIKFLSRFTVLTGNQIRYILHRGGKVALRWIVERVIDSIREEIIAWNISFPAIWYRIKVDGSSGKLRRIGIQNIKQQLYDYIAVEALGPFWRRFGEYQYASIKGRGTTKGKNVIQRWMRNPNMRYFVKLDVRKCFESIDHDKLMNFLRRHIKNDLLLRLVELLIDSFEQGLSIGSYLSQYLCNAYMSIIYHQIKEHMYKIRRGTRANLVRRCLIYMDDILMVGSRKRDLERAIKLVSTTAKDMGLTIKPNYQVYTVDGYCVDMLGYRVYRTHTEIRKAIFIRIRRAYKKFRKNPTTKAARKCISYYGYLKHSNSRRIEKRWKVKSTIKNCKGAIRHEHESTVFQPATAG